MNIYDKRNLYIDIAKGIGIIVVVFGHNMQIYSVNAYLYPFAVHFFFFMAGYNFNLAKYREHPWNFLWTRVLRLLLPYIATGIFSYLFYLAMAPILSLPLITARTAVDGMMIGQISDLEFNIVLWFLPALFCADIIFLTLGYKLKGFYLLAGVILVTAAGFIFGRYDQQLIFGLDIAMTLQLLVYSGYILKQSNLLEKVVQLRRSGLMNFFSNLFIFLPLIAIIAYSGQKAAPDIATRVYGQPALFFIAGLSGSILICMISLVIADAVPRGAGRILAAVGRASLDILISHIPIIRFIASLFAIFGGVWIYDTYRNYWYLLFFFGAAIPTLTHALIAFILNKKIASQNHFH
jgi:acyltransferase